MNQHATTIEADGDPSADPRAAPVTTAKRA